MSRGLRWYVSRLGAMSPSEVAWRVRSAGRDVADRVRVATGRVPSPPLDARQPGFTVCDLPVGAWSALSGREAAWRGRLVARADEIRANRLSFFDLDGVHLGDPIDWNRDHAAGKAAPMGFAANIDYRDFDLTGDCKLVWEPSRHLHLVVLARAWRATGQAHYAQAVAAHLQSWLDQCPYGRGMQWRSPLELAIRLINWVWALDLIRGSGAVEGALADRVLRSAYLHLWDVSRKFSRGSSANNHLIGEAAGVFVGAAYFAGFPGALAWGEESRRILEEEIVSQTHPDGANREQALAYHVFVLQFFTIAGMVARRTGRDLSAAYWRRLEDMYGFLAALAEGGPLPMFGDADDGYVLDLGDRLDARGWLPVGAALFRSPSLKRTAQGLSETARWLLGPAEIDDFESVPAADDGGLGSRAFPDAGHYLLQSGRGPGAVSAVFDCGPLGFGSIAAHGHADALGIVFRAFGADVLVDPGTYDYFTFPEWREYFRSTRAHNTLSVDDLDQSVMLGAFLWGSRARARCLRFEPRPAGGTVVGEHDGYTRLAEPVVHRRTVALDRDAGELVVRDELVARKRHHMALHLHFAEGLALRPRGSSGFDVEGAPRPLALELDPSLSVEVHQGATDPIAGWVSRGYHRKAPAPTVIGRRVFEGDTAVTWRLTWRAG